MIPFSEHDNINDAFWALATQSQYWPVETRRGGDRMHDSPCPVMTCISNPQRRVLNIPHRNNNIAAAAAETLWVLAGRNDVQFLKFYLPRAGDFSDDGKTWRAGYGPRLRHFGEDVGEVGNPSIPRFTAGIDQIEFVVNKLKKFSQDRQAVITLLDPLEDSYVNLVTKDFPCTQSLSFMVRDGKLDLTVFIRSNDLVWGWSGVNVFEFTVMQELVANMIGVPIGKYYHISNNLHVYEKHGHWKMIERVASLEPHEVQPYQNWKDPKYPRFDNLHQLDQQLKDFFVLEEVLRRKPNVFVEHFMGARHYQATLIDDLANVVFAYCAFKQSNFEVTAYARDLIEDSALQASFDRLLAWEQRPRVPRMEVTE